jgi:hypothetical protein
MNQPSPNPVPNPTPTRRRQPGEFFGLERQLWDDRHRGVLSTELIERLNGAAKSVEAGLPSALGAERARLTRLHEGRRAAREVLEAARDALREGETPALGPRA